ncbi:recombinase family protein (plasmid) [Fibrella sp. ES10-3-2-2]
MIPVALFVRVSTKEQDYTRQVADLTAYAERQGYQIAHIIHEKGSATKRSNVERPELEWLLQLCQTKAVQKVLVTEFSRLGRRRSETPALMEAITQAGVSIYAHNLGLETLLANGKRNPVASIVIAVMIKIDAMETERLSERILSGLAQARRNGKQLGRPKGTTKPVEALLATYAPVVKDLKKGLSIRQIAAIRHLSADTVQRVKRAWKATTPAAGPEE